VVTLNFSTPGCCCCWGSRRPVAAKSRRPRGRSKAAAEQRLQLGVSGNPELAPGSKELAPEERGAVKILHVGLLLQGPPPASTRKDRRLWGRVVVAPYRQAASEAQRHRTDGPDIEGAGARGVWGRQISPRRAAAAGAAGGQQRQKAGCCEGAMQSLLAGRLPFRVVVMIVVDMISIGPTPSNRIMPILPSSAGADGGLSW
jgi:hypothetical protein